MGTIIQSNFRARKNFGSIAKIIDVPNLIQIQKASYEKFLQADTAPNDRKDYGLQGVFRSVFPIKSFDENAELVFREYQLEKPKYDVDECRQRGMTFAAPIKVTIELITYEPSGTGGDRAVRDIKQQEVYFGEIPLMTDTGTFIINGTERVVVSQLHRSPGVFFDHDKGKTHSSAKLLYSARVIPYRGSWLDFEFDPKDIIYVRIDRRRKLHATVLLRALGYTTEQLLNYYYDVETVFLEGKGQLAKSVEYNILAGQRATADIKVGQDVLVKKGTKFTKAAVKRLKEAKVEHLAVDRTEVVGRVAARDIIDPETGEVLVSCNETITETRLDALERASIQSFKVLFMDGLVVGTYLRDTLVQDKYDDPDGPMAPFIRQYGHAVAAQIDIYRKLRPGDIPEPKEATKLLENLFFNAERYDLSRVGRLKLNYKFYKERAHTHQPKLDLQVLTKEDILLTVKHLIEIKNGRGSVDDIDHLGNRRVRAVGELLENQYRIGLVRMERAIKERMSISPELDALMPHDLINAKPVSAVVKEYFGSSQLSQFMDQTNPLSEVTHKRRLSALGPGGLTRERAGFEVRDVHATHYGRICPIETPEGPNIGLIASLSTYARVNEYGFVETPYRRVENGAVKAEVIWLSALEEEGQHIAQATAATDEHGKLTEQLVSSRYNGEFKLMPPDSITLMDVSPNQLVSVAAALIPFLEHDDANRALMGANMQRQAVPLIRTMAPMVGTGLEGQVARDSGVCVTAKRPGVVESSDSARIVVRAEGRRGEEPDIYNLTKYQRSNQNTCWNQKPIVKPGERVEVGDVLADGPATDTGELALGSNALVAFMPWGGYNFEDSILISERIAKQDIFTSIHIEEFECVARDTKLGKEEITRDIPNVGEEALKDLDDSGIVRIGAEVKPGDILVGKITPKGETQLSPEEKLLRAIFGEKAGDVRDTSLRVPPGVAGIVINARVFARKGTEKDDRARDIEDQERARLEKDRDVQVKIVRESYYRRIRGILVGRSAQAKLVDDKGKVLLTKGAAIDEAALDQVPRKLWQSVSLDDAGSAELREVYLELEDRVAQIERNCAEKVERLAKGDELPPGVIKMVKVYVAIKRKLQVGDKMAGRHGNKGVVSRILPEEDMPYLPDGTPVDLVLNPLGVPSRMNVGQILEVHLGWAAYELGRKLQRLLDTRAPMEGVRALLLSVFQTDTDARRILKDADEENLRRFAAGLQEGVFFASPVFNGAPETQIKKHLDLAHLPVGGQTILFDGRSGDAFEHDVTVGVMYMLKLHHLVDDKIHARSIGPYSLVTQQPLGGKAQFGGQRLGEMEVWAMEAYGAAYALQEFLTVKSDDVQGRTRMYEAIVKGEYTLEPGVPESFNVLVKELQSLCLNVELVEDETRAAGDGQAAE
ncbi:MAG: DNA-directed RNA polymerase subunit beta [Deltaproteobacteria bacterium]|nr:DNA-directed RNA polymerase subunit beta [Deltaproteobacteria bacterium]